MSQNIDKLKIIKRIINHTQVLDTQSSFPFLKKVNWKVLFWTILNYFHNHRIHLGNSQWFSLVPVQTLFFFWHSRLSPQKLIRLFELKLTVELMSACVFWTSSWVVAFSQCWASYPLLCWVCWKKRLFPHYRIFLQFSPKRCRWIWTWIECKKINVLICEANTVQFDE